MMRVKDIYTYVWIQGLVYFELFHNSFDTEVQQEIVKVKNHQLQINHIRVLNNLKYHKDFKHTFYLYPQVLYSMWVVVDVNYRIILNKVNRYNLQCEHSHKSKIDFLFLHFVKLRNQDYLDINFYLYNIYILL